MVLAEGTHLKGVKEGRTEGRVFVLSNLTCLQEEIMPTGGKHLESIFSDTSRRCFISFVDN